MPTSRKLSSNLFQQIAVKGTFKQMGESQSGWFMVKDREHRFQFVNQRFADTLGKKPEDIIGLSDVELGIPDAILYGDPDAGLPGLRTLDEKCMVSDKSMRTIDGSVTVGTGHFESTLVVRTPLHNDEGEVIGVLLHAIDHSDVRRLEAQIESANETASDLGGKLVTLDVLLSDLLVCHDRQQLLQKITDTVVSQTLAHSASVAALTESGEKLELTTCSGMKAETKLGDTYSRGEGIIGQAWAEHDIIYTGDTDESCATSDFHQKTQICAIPITNGDHVVAVMSSVLNGEGALSLRDDIPTLRRICNLAGIALTNASLLDTAHSTLQQTRTLADVSRQLATTTNVDEACGLVCDAMLVALDVCKSATVMIDEHGRCNLNVARYTASARDQNTPEDHEHLMALANRCFDSAVYAAPCVANVDSTGLTKSIESLTTDKSISNSFAQPLFKNGQIAGAICIARSKKRGPLKRSALDTLTTITSQLSSTLERQDFSSTLHHQAFHDRLTGLPNRHQFEATLEEVLDGQQAGALLFIDLDGFKDVNDTLGHAVGDQLLLLVAGRLRSQLREEDTIARVGGDEFVAILPSTSDREDTLAYGERILNSLSTSYLIGKDRIDISASIGLSRFPEDGDTVDILLRNADVAMYQAKHNGKGRLLSFDKDLADEIQRRTQLQSDLLIALEQNQLELHYQPQVCCLSGTVKGVEALLRWTHLEHGTISPAIFIPIAEQAGFINEIGSWVLNRAARQIADWKGTALGDLRISINIAASQFQQNDFVEHVFSTLAYHDAPCDRLELEVTESVVMNDVNAVVERLRALRDAGIRIAVDDFGTGYSSLIYLQNLPLDVLKIDRAFISPLQDEQADQSLAKIITLMASGLGLETVAEGVETTKQHDAVVDLGCEMIQGFYHSAAVTASELPVVVKQLEVNTKMDRAA